MLTNACLCCFASIFFLSIFFQTLLSRKNLTVASRVELFSGKGHQRTVRDDELKTPIRQRIFKPLLGKVTGIMLKILPSHKETVLERKLQQAGNPGNFSPREFLAFYYLFAAFFIIIAIFIFKLLDSATLFLMPTLPAALYLGWKLPDIYLNHKKRQRQENIKKKLPDFLDLLTVNVEAGLGFDSAILNVTKKLKGPLSEEIKKMLREINLGKPRREALRNAAERIDIDDFSSFTGTIILADELGMSIGHILRMQSSQMRIKRRQKVEEKAMQAPVKMIFPLIFFIFPAIFVVLLGPALLQISKVLFK